MPNLEQITCYKQVGCTDCGLFAIAYAVDILNANNVYDLIFDQIKMRKQLIACLNNEKSHLNFTKIEIHKKHTEKHLHHGTSPDVQLD